MLTFGQGLVAMKGPSCRKRTVQGIWQDDMSESGVVSMNQCDCDERIGIEINSFELYEELRKFFEYQVQEGVFCDIPVESPYFCGYGLKPEEVKDEFKWYADKWYKCKCCGTLWEFQYPDFPAKGFVRKFSDGNIELKNSITKNRLISIILMFHLMQLKQLDVIWMVHISRSA